MTTDTTTGLSEAEREMFDPIFTPGGPLDGVYAVAAKIAEGRLAKVEALLDQRRDDLIYPTTNSTTERTMLISVAAVRAALAPADPREPGDARAATEGEHHE